MDQPDRGKADAAAVLPRTAGIRRDGAAQIDHWHALFPDLQIAHVGFRVPAHIGRVEAVLDRERAAAAGGALEKRHAEARAVLAVAAHLDHRAVDLADEHLLLEAAGQEAPAEQPLEAAEGRQQQRPGCGRGAAFGVRIGPGSLRQVEAGRQPGAIVHPALEVHVLGQRDEHAAVHARRGAVHGVITPGLSAVEVHEHVAGLIDRHLDRYGIEPVGIAQQLVAGLAAGNVAVEGVAAIDAGHGELAGAGELGAAAFFDELLAGLFVVVEAQMVDQLLDLLADLDAGGDLGLLVENPIDRHAQVALEPDQVVAPQVVVLADLLGGDEQALGIALLGQGHVAAGRDAADLQLVAHGADPADHLAIMEDRDHVHHVGALHRADEGVVVGEDVAVADTRVVLVVLADHPLDEAAGGVHVHHDAVGQRHGVTLGRIERDHHLAHLAYAGRGRDAPRHLARRDAGGAQLDVQCFVFERVLLA